MSQTLSLESFEDVLCDDSQPSLEYNHGFEEGLAAGKAIAQTEAAVLDDAFVQALSNIEFTYAEAHQQILQSLAPLFTTLVDRILPHCVENGFADQIVDLLLRTATDEANASITVHVHPDAHEAVAARIADVKVQVNLDVDPSLDPHAAWVQHGDRETLLNADQLLGQITDLLNAVPNPTDRMTAHG